MKDYLIDVPVKVNIWIRPECQRKQFEIIKQVRPSILFLISDGGRNEQEWNAIKKNRKIFDEEIDWDCKIYKLYEKKNIGMYAISKKRNELIWSTVDKCIFLEDDLLPTKTFFYFCKEMLDRYENDKRINMICGMNHLGIYNKVNSDYFFSKQGSIWGYATWKREYLKFNDFSYYDDPYVLGLLKEKTRKNKVFRKRLLNYPINYEYEGHIPALEFYIEFSVYAHNQLQIVPKYNLISNIGCDKNATHSDRYDVLPKSVQRIFNMKSYELDRPLIHPKYIIADKDYEKQRNRIMAYNHPIVLIYRKSIQLIKTLKIGDYKRVLKKIKSKIRGKKEK
ncbi:hypothetical protein [uncultured Dubosiella sp.]|uniref:hypothetical protein n=1 Tax=uncultured Dubosiella sp. TaxID=1937011 RepID=UPI00263A26C5|nr:hypothetical protein [uncultured Dubosiella sp.]